MQYNKQIFGMFHILCICTYTFCHVIGAFFRSNENIFLFKTTDIKIQGVYYIKSVLVQTVKKTCND